MKEMFLKKEIFLKKKNYNMNKKMNKNMNKKMKHKIININNYQKQNEINI